MWKQFDIVVQLPSCYCQASKGFNDFSQLIKLMQFLMGLDDVYQPVRTNMLTREPLPTVKTAFSIISREESHRFSSGFYKGRSQNVGFLSKNTQSFDNKKRFNRGPNPNLKCTHCNKLAIWLKHVLKLLVILSQIGLNLLLNSFLRVILFPLKVLHPIPLLVP